VITRRSILASLIPTPLALGNDNPLTPVGYMRDVDGERQIYDGRKWVALSSAEGLAVMNYILGRIP